MNDEDIITGRANCRCELCGYARGRRAGHGRKEVVELAVVYMDGDRENIAPNNVRVMCQSCERFYGNQHHVHEDRVIERCKQTIDLF